MRKVKQSTTKSSIKKAQYNLDRQTVKISALSSGNVCKYKFNWQRCFTRKRLIRKSCYNEKIWILAFKQWVEKANRHCRKTVQKIKCVVVQLSVSYGI